MDLLPTPEQDEIASASASFLAGQLPMTRIRELIAEDDPVDASAWAAAGDLGWFALGLDEAAGGIGLGLADEVLLFREIGRGLAPGPYLSTVLAARVASALPELAGALLGGTARAGLGLADGSLEIGRDRVRGALRVVDGVGAEHVLVCDSNGAAMLASADLALEPEVCLDESSRLAACASVDAVPVAYVSAADDPIWRRGLVLSAAMLVGIGEACRDIAIEHAKSRVQFDRPIGVHQAVKHPIADMAVRVEAAWPLVIVAALASDEDSPEARYQALSARLVATDAASSNAAATVQVLGGMGFTFEHDANLYVKRARVLSATFGGRTTQLAALLAEPAPA